MNRNQHKGTARRARLAAAVLVGAMVVPGLAVADHTTCTPGEITNTCQEFDPQFEGGAQTAFTDTPSLLTTRVSQTQSGPTSGHDAPVLATTYLLPKWQFALNATRAGQVSDGPNIGNPSTSCADVIVGEENDADNAPANLGRAENVSGYLGLNARLNGGAVIAFNANRSLSLASYNAGTGTALLCWYAYTTSTAVANQAAREHIIPITLQRVQTGELLNGEDISLNFGWKMSYDLTSLYGFPALFDAGIGVIDQLLSISDVTSGNWHVDDFTNQPARALFAKTPKAPAYAEYRGYFSTCLEGFNAADPAITTTEQAEALAPETLCKNGSLYSTVRSIREDVRHPPNATVFDFGRLTGPATAGLGVGNGARYGLVRGTNNVTFKWTQSGSPAGETIKGYLLTLAVPGQVSNMHFEHVVTNPTDVGFDARQPCGADGKATPCSLTLSFPLNTVGAAPLDVNGKYDVSLITIYEGLNGATDKRTDGRCDNGTGFGTDCPLTDPAFRIATHTSFDWSRIPGISTWQFMLRAKAWPLAFVENGALTRSGGGPSCTPTPAPACTVPKYVLLVDFALKQGEFVRWNPLTFEQAFYAPSNLIVGDNTAGGVVSFGSAGLTGHTDNWLYEGIVHPNGVNNGSTVTVSGDAIAPLAQSKGIFTLYNLKGFPGQTPTGAPQLKVLEAFTGTPVAAS